MRKLKFEDCLLQRVHELEAQVKILMRHHPYSEEVYEKRRVSKLSKAQKDAIWEGRKSLGRHENDKAK